jgi:hypothetical protein
MRFRLRFRRFKCGWKIVCPSPVVQADRKRRLAAHRPRAAADGEEVGINGMRQLDRNKRGR